MSEQRDLPSFPPRVGNYLICTSHSAKKKVATMVKDTHNSECHITIDPARSLWEEGVIRTATPMQDFELDWESSPSSFLFTILIWIPCNCLYGEHPPALLSRAKHDNTEPLRKLIHLYKSITQKPMITVKMQQWQITGARISLLIVVRYSGERIWPHLKILEGGLVGPLAGPPSWQTKDKRKRTLS